MEKAELLKESNRVEDLIKKTVGEKQKQEGCTEKELKKVKKKSNSIEFYCNFVLYIKIIQN